jgi:hypothetical protein
LNWEWVFSNTIPWHALAIVSTEVSKTEEQLVAERAQLQLDSYFQRFSAAPVSRTPMWRMLVRLREYMQEDVSPVHDSPNSHGILPTSSVESAAMMFADDLMLDFGSGGLSAADGDWNDQVAMQDAQDFPW